MKSPIIRYRDATCIGCGKKVVTDYKVGVPVKCEDCCEGAV